MNLQTEQSQIISKNQDKKLISTIIIGKSNWIILILNNLRLPVICWKTGVIQVLTIIAIYWEKQVEQANT